MATDISSQALCFSVHGIPIPQGSTRAFIPKGWSRPIITAANAKTKPWRQEIAGVVVSEMEKTGFARMTKDVPVKVCAGFSFPRPHGLPKRVNSKTTKPDLDKLVRSLLDAMTGLVFEDDSQVVQLHVRKTFGIPGVHVVVEECGFMPPGSPLFNEAIQDSDYPF